MTRSDVGTVVKVCLQDGLPHCKRMRNPRAYRPISAFYVCDKVMMPMFTSKSSLSRIECTLSASRVVMRFVVGAVVICAEVDLARVDLLKRGLSLISRFGF